MKHENLDLWQCVPQYQHTTILTHHEAPRGESTVRVDVFRQAELSSFGEDHTRTMHEL
jgi:hypothetical protein